MAQTDGETTGVQTHGQRVIVPRTPQETFDAIVLGLRRQGAPSQDPGSKRCLYRGRTGTIAEGRRCAAGQVMNDDVYHPDLEGKEAAEVCSLRENPFDGHHLGVIESLQWAHDQSTVSSLSSLPWLDQFLQRARLAATTWKIDDLALVVPLESAEEGLLQMRRRALSDETP